MTGKKSTMKYFNSTFNECVKINTALVKLFRDDQMYFYSASRTQIIYVLDNSQVIFYYPIDRQI